MWKCPQLHLVRDRDVGPWKPQELHRILSRLPGDTCTGHLTLIIVFKTLEFPPESQTGRREKKTKEELVPQDWSSHGSDNLLVLLAEESRAQTVMGLGGWWVGRHFDWSYLVNRHPPST